MCRGTVCALDDNERGRVFRKHPGDGRQGIALVATLDLDIASETIANSELRETLSSADEAGVREVVIDVSGVFVDVRGLSVLLAAAQRARMLRIRFAVVPSRSLRTICRAVPIDSELVLLDGPHDPRTKDAVQP